MAGLGVTTVSRALKDAPDIGEDTKKRVHLIAEQIGYQPNRAGVRLRTGRTNVIALVLDVEDKIMSVTPHLVHGVSEVVAEKQYHLIVLPYTRSSDPLEPVRYIVETGAADGIIFSRIEPNDARIHYLSKRSFAFATHGRSDMGIDHAYHDFSNEAYAREAVHRLSKRGRRRLALLPPPTSLTYYRFMTDGFLKGLSEIDAIEIPFSGIDVDSDLGEIKERAEQIMRGPNQPDGVICSSGASALSVAAGIEAADLKIGRDVDLVAKQFINTLFWLRDSIDVANEDAIHAGRELAKAVFAVIDGKDPATLQSLSHPRWLEP